MSEPVRILIVDDELHVRTSLAIWLREEGFQVATADSGEHAIEMVNQRAPDILMVDIKMPGMDGLELHRRIRRLAPEATVVLMTAYAAVDTAVQALKDGAYDYIVKPFDPEHVSRLVRKAAALHMRATEHREIRQRLEAALPRMVAEPNGVMAGVLEQADLVAPSEAHVLIEGEQGTGKELLARRIHARSRRVLGPLVLVDCSLADPAALRSELLGHERGSLPGTESPRRGKLELAHEGTMILRALDRAPDDVQADLERVLAQRKVAHAGGHSVVDADIRLIATSNRDLESLVSIGQFRSDLFARLRGCRIEVPPLRARPDDIPALSRWIVGRLAQPAGRIAPELSKEALAVLSAHPWPGNVSELQSALERAFKACAGPAILPENLPINADSRPGTLSLARMEELHIRQVLELFGHDVDRAAAELGIDRAALESKLSKYGIRCP